MGAASPKANHPTHSLLATNRAIINMLVVTSEKNEVPKAQCVHTHTHTHTIMEVGAMY
jgi:hypothetical protein